MDMITMDDGLEGHTFEADVLPYRANLGIESGGQYEAEATSALLELTWD